jgi:hypothetical protein
VGFQLSRKDKKAYEEFRSSKICRKHATSREYITALRLISHVEMDRMQSWSVHARHVKTLSMSTTASTSSLPTWSILNVRNGLGRTAYYASLKEGISS